MLSACWAGNSSGLHAPTSEPLPGRGCGLWVPHCTFSFRSVGGWKLGCYPTNPTLVLSSNTKYLLHGFSINWISQQCNGFVNQGERVLYFIQVFIKSCSPVWTIMPRMENLTVADALDAPADCVCVLCTFLGPSLCVSVYVITNVFVSHVNIKQKC